jgi:hypothetical protein
MRAGIILLITLLLGAGVVALATADDGCGHVYDGRHSCDGAAITISWSAVIQQGCTPTFTIERRCGASGTYTTLETDWDGLSYTDKPNTGCLFGWYYKITIHCSDCPGGDSIVIGPITCP